MDTPYNEPGRSRGAYIALFNRVTEKNNNVKTTKWLGILAGILQ